MFSQFPDVSFTVYGKAVPQGSKRFVGVRAGRGVMVESGKGHADWRSDILAEALKVGRPMLDGPLEVNLRFTITKPASAPKTRKTWPDKKPDIDKLARAVLDALTIAGVIVDDARVVALNCSKVFPGEHESALDLPGVDVAIWKVTE